MSAVSKEEIRELATLARLALQDEEVTALQSELSGILELMEELAQVDTEGVAPMTHATLSAAPLRPDRIEPSLDRERVLAASASTEDDHFSVPSILPSGANS